MRHAREMKGALRRKAEARLADAAPMPTAASAETLLHELQVHQIELQLQNEALRQAQSELEASHDRYVDLFESAPVAYVTLSPEGRIADGNLLATRILGLTQAEMLQRQFEDFIAPTDLERWREQATIAWAGAANPPLNCELLLRNGAGLEFPAQLECVVRDRARTGPTIRIAFFDITERSEAAAEIQRLAYFDPLTHLPNRRLLLDRLTQTLAAAARHGRYGAILFLDLDDFKRLNDTRGHSAGDQLLVEVGHRLRTGLREGDTVARMGGDEFVVILDGLGLTREDATVLARTISEKLRQDIARPIDLGQFGFHSTVSIGARLFGPGETVEQLLRHADLALYKAKSAGRNRVRFFDPSMQAALDAGGGLEGGLGQTWLEE